MDYKNALRNLITLVAILGAIAVASVMTRAQDKAENKKSMVQRTSGRDPFRKYEPVVKTKSALSKLEPPSIQARIDRYRAQKMAAATAHVAPPKPTTALLLSEMQVTGIFRTPRGWAAMVEAVPIKLSYVIYPGETFFDGQLVAIEESRLVFRRDIVWADGRREKSVEIKPLRQPNPIEAMTSPKSSTNAPAPESEKPTAPEKQ
jgi:hypothetical protein